MSDVEDNSDNCCASCGDASEGFTLGCKSCMAVIDAAIPCPEKDCWDMIMSAEEHEHGMCDSCFTVHLMAPSSMSLEAETPSTMTHRPSVTFVDASDALSGIHGSAFDSHMPPLFRSISVPIYQTFSPIEQAPRRPGSPPSPTYCKKAKPARRHSKPYDKKKAK